MLVIMAYDNPINKANKHDHNVQYVPNKKTSEAIKF